MLIANTARRLIAIAVTASDGSIFTGTNELTASVYLESSDGDDGKFWDESSTNWQAAPTIWPTGSYILAGQWGFDLPATASDGREDQIIHFTFVDFTASDSISTICGGAEHYIWVAAPISVTNAGVTFSASVWDATMTDHVSAGSAGKALTDATGSLINTAAISASVWDAVRVDHVAAGSMGQASQFTGSLIDAAVSSRATGSIPSVIEISASVWDAVMTDHVSAGSSGRALTDASASVLDSGDLAAISASIWDATMTDHTTAGSSGRALTDASGSRTTITEGDIAALSASVWDAVLQTDHTTAGSAAKYLTDLTGSLATYESEPAEPA